MNGLPVGTDGTFKDYCDVIRTAGEGAPIAVEVLRFDTSEVLKGEINGDQPIQLAFSFAEEVGDEVGEDSDAAARPTTYESVTDDTNQIKVAVPTAWTERTTAPVRQGRRAGALHRGLDRHGRVHQRLHRPGRAVRQAARRRPTSTPSWPQYGFPGDCTDGGITDYSDPVFTGKYQLWQDCDGTTNDVVTLVAVPADASYLAVIQAQIATDADLDALQHAFDSFNTVS